MLLSVGFVAYNKSFYDAQFKINNTAEKLEITPQELTQIRDKIIDYIGGKTDKLELDGLFDAAELSHMADARAVFITAKILAWVFMVLGVVGLIISRKPKGIIWGCGIFLGIIALIGLFALIGFDGIFTLFHQIFFPQGNWAFSSSSAMITMLPESLFMTAAFIIAAAGAGFAVVLGTVAVVLLKCKTVKS